MHPIAKLDHQYVWHPFTQMADWLRSEPIVIARGEGAVLEDVRGRQYIDANSSIWTNLHGHANPRINAAITAQLKKIAHSSALGFANEPASLYAEMLVKAAQPLTRARLKSGPALEKVFYSDDGSTAMEVALKLAYEFSRRSGNKKPRFLSLDRAYHGDTVGAVSVGHIDLFHKAYSGLLFKSDKAMAPYCYRCRYNKAKPERADARDYRKCASECLGHLAHKLEARSRKGPAYAAFVFEPLMQGSAGMIAQPPGWLNAATTLAREHGALLIADEVMTGFGRMGCGEPLHPGKPCERARPKLRVPLFACQHENVRPDFMALAKGLSGGYLPMAATLTTRAVFDAFLGRYNEFKTFFHGHSFTGNQLGSAAAMESLRLLQGMESIRSRAQLEERLQRHLAELWKLPNVGDIRRTGLVAGVELVKDWRTRKAFALQERAGIRVCERMAKLGVLTRPIGNVVVIMPPYCTSQNQLAKTFEALTKAIQSELGR